MLLSIKCQKIVKNVCKKPSETTLNVFFCRGPKPKRYSVYYHVPHKKNKTLNPHIWEAETSKCLGFLLKKKNQVMDHLRRPDRCSPTLFTSFWHFIDQMINWEKKERSIINEDNTYFWMHFNSITLNLKVEDEEFRVETASGKVQLPREAGGTRGGFLPRQ